MSSQAAQTNCLAKEGKYLVFALGKEDYGLEIIKVREIIGMMHMTALPQVPNYVKGVINLRGKVIPIIDLRIKFGMPEIEVTSESCIIVINLQEMLMGVIIDKVKEVLDIRQADISPAPHFGEHVHTDYILGVARTADSVKILLNIEKVLSDDMAMADKLA